MLRYVNDLIILVVRSGGRKIVSLVQVTVIVLGSLSQEDQRIAIPGPH